MKISRCTKAVIYQIAAIVLTGVTVYFLLPMRSEEGLEAAYFRSNTFLFVSAAVLLGTGIYTLLSYTRRHREHLPDSVLLLLTGLVLMIMSVATIFVFGGLDSPFTESGYTAANVNIITLSMLPFPFFIRGLVLSFGRSAEQPANRRAAFAAGILAAAAIVLAVLFGGLFRLVEYRQNPSILSSYTENSVWQST